MSWLARSLANTFNSDDDDKKKVEEEKEEEEEGEEGGKGVKEDLSELTKSFTRQLWGVASFLAPPPTTPTTHDYPSSSSPSAGLAPDSDSPSSLKRSQYEDSHLIAGDSPRLAGIRNDLSEIGGRFKSGISMLASGNTVNEISKFASGFLPFGSGDDEEDSEEMGDEAVGTTEEVLTFARNISKHPETWLDFPLLADDQYADDT